MSLPNGFQTSYDYFKQTIEFLRLNSWIYQEANTCFLKSKILNQMPQEYMEYFHNIETEELNQFPYVHQPLENLKVENLMKFREKLSTLIAEEAFKEPKEFKSQKKFEKLKKINVKKQHEIQRLAAEVKEILQTKQKHNENEAKTETEKYVLIDFGSGLGYLSEMLYELLNKNLLVLGLESDLRRVEAAEQRVNMYMPNATTAIQYRQQFITENSKDFIAESVEELLKSNYQQVSQQIPTKMAIIGLHACADLTITSMKLFFQMSHVQHLIIMPCCYHKMKMCADANLKFENFPLSESLKQVLLEDDTVNYASATSASYLNRPFLRLACQQTLKRWHHCSQEEHRQHGREMFFRAVAESLKQQQGVKDDAQLVVVKRKEGKIDACLLAAKDIESFNTFSRLYGLKSKTTNEFVAWSDNHRVKFAEIMKQYPKGWRLAEGLTCLQTSMQKLCENLVLYDRLCYMQETALNLNLNLNVRYEKLMDEELSPRCYVLIAEKL